jgi:hypothetical protein
VDGITQEMQAHQMGKAAGQGLDFKAMKKVYGCIVFKSYVSYARS